MSSILPYLIVGITAGSVYGLAGCGLVLTYKTSNVFNFAFGALATIAAFTFYLLDSTLHMGWVASALVAVLGCGVVIGLLMEPLARQLSKTSLELQIVATVGLLLGIEGFFQLVAGSETRAFPQYLPNSTFTIGGAHVTYSQVIVTAAGLVVTIVLYAYFRATRLGVAMRGVVENPDLLAISGTSPVKVRRWAWVIGSVVACLAGVLLAPSENLDALVLTLLVVQAFGAAAIGRFVSLPATYLGGIGIGVVAALLTKYINSSGTILSGLPASLPFIALFIVLLVSRPRDRLSENSRIRLPHFPGGSPRREVVQATVVGAFLLTVPVWAGGELTQWTTMLATTVLLLSLGLLVRTSGQVSLCQVTFAACGAVALSKLVTSAGIPWLPALLLSGLVVVPIGALLAIPAIRASGLYLALATLGFGLLVQDMFYQSSLMFGTFGSIVVPRPSLPFVDVSSDEGFYYVTLMVLVLAAGVMTAVTRTRLGRLLRATAVSPLAVATNGTSLTGIRVLIFCISAYMAGIAGALLGATLTIGSPASFPPLLSLTYVAVVIIVAGAAPWYGLVAAAGVVLIPAYWTSANAALGLQVLFGVSAVVVALHPQGLALPRFGRRAIVTGDKELAVSGDASDGERIRPARSTELIVDELGVRFGGLVAVDKLSLVAPAGRITGLIGPNGAGKTTAFNACSGLVRGKVSGELSFNRTRLNDLGSAARARLGLGRTFQQPELCDSLTVRENVAVGAEAGLAGRRIVSQAISRRHESDLIRRRVDAALAVCELSDASAMVVSTLPTGQRRFVELARCLAGDYSILMLDEPSSGLDERETHQLGDVVQRAVEERGIGVLLVEHDVELVRRLCEYVYVLDFGQVIAAGNTAEVLAAPEVKAAYLGEDVRTLSPAPVVEAGQ